MPLSSSLRLRRSECQMKMTKRDIDEELQHQRELLKRRRSNLRKMQMREAEFGGMPPLDVMNQLDRLEEQVHSAEAEIARLETVAAETSLSLAEATYRRILAEVFDNALGYPTTLGRARLEEERLNQGILPERAKE